MFYFLLYSVGIIVICATIRTVVEMIFPTLSKKTELSKAQMVWENFALRLLPILVGVVSGIVVTSFPYPEAIAQEVGGRVYYGAVAAFCTQWTYPLMRSVLYKRWNIPEPEKTDVPPNLPPAPPGV